MGELSGQISHDLAIVLRKEMVTGAKDLIRYSAFDCFYVLAVDVMLFVAVSSCIQSIRTSNL